jgi:hypothetical protein
MRIRLGWPHLKLSTTLQAPRSGTQNESPGLIRGYESGAEAPPAKQSEDNSDAA